MNPPNPYVEPPTIPSVMTVDQYRAMKARRLITHKRWWLRLRGQV